MFVKHGISAAEYFILAIVYLTFLQYWSLRNNFLVAKRMKSLQCFIETFWESTSGLVEASRVETI